MDKAVMKIVLCTILALLAFAGNSIFCRLALGGGAIDAASFTIIRLISGIVVLMVISLWKKNRSGLVQKGSWSAATALFLYAVTFSFAYISLDTGIGALILFGAVQITMIAVSLLKGNRLHTSEWIGTLIAFAGFVYLVSPGLATPSMIGFCLMTIAGIAWGTYTLLGRGSQSPLNDTAYNFLRTLPFVVLLVIFTLKDANVSWEGVWLAVLSGGIASGVGYTIWYIALGGLTAVQAAVVQLSVPMIAAIGGLLFVDEVISMRLVISSILILGGILAVILGRYYFIQQVSSKA